VDDYFDPLEIRAGILDAHSRKLFVIFWESGSFSMCSRARAAIGTFSNSFTLEALDSDHDFFSERLSAFSIWEADLYNMSSVEFMIEFTTFRTTKFSVSTVFICDFIVSSEFPPHFKIESRSLLPPHYLQTKAI
jgi:hypothetical protein